MYIFSFIMQVHELKVSIDYIEYDIYIDKHAQHHYLQ